MALNFETIVSLLDSNFDVFEFPRKINLPDEGIKVCLEDRPEEHLVDGNAPFFFKNFKQRYEFLARAFGINVDHELKSLVSFLNGDADKVTIYHYSLFPIKTEFDRKELGKFSLAQLDEATFEKFVSAHSSFGWRPVQALGWDLKEFTHEYRLLVTSKETVERVVDGHKRHIFFDRLDNIYSNFHILIRLFQHFGDQDYVQPGSISSDSFPNASSSWSSVTRKCEINRIEEASCEKIEALMHSLQSNMFYRLLMRAEIQNRDVFARLVFLRSMLDPFFNENEQAVMKMGKKSDNKTELQSEFVLRTLAKNQARYANVLTHEELTKFLSMRNSFVHPQPDGDVTKLHILYDKEHLFRKLVYEFVLTNFLQSITEKTKLFYIGEL